MPLSKILTSNTFHADQDFPLNFQANENFTLNFQADENFTLNFIADENFTLASAHNMSKYDPSPQMKAFYATMFVLLETLGNFLLVCMIIYEKCGMDSQKRDVTNQLLSSICVSRIFHNIIVMPILTINTIFGYPLGKTIENNSILFGILIVFFIS